MSDNKFFSIPKRVKILTVFLIFSPIWLSFWLSLPGMTADMKLRPWYYLWTKGLFPLNETVLNDFTRDHEYKESLAGKPVEVLIPLFPEFTKASNYSPDSERYRYSKELLLKYKEDDDVINIDDIYWLTGDQLYNSGFYVITFNGKIV